MKTFREYVNEKSINFKVGDKIRLKKGKKQLLLKKDVVYEVKEIIEKRGLIRVYSASDYNTDKMIGTEDFDKIEIVKL